MRNSYAWLMTAVCLGALMVGTAAIAQERDLAPPPPLMDEMAPNTAAALENAERLKMAAPTLPGTSPTDAAKDAAVQAVENVIDAPVTKVTAPVNPAAAANAVSPAPDVAAPKPDAIMVNAADVVPPAQAKKKKKAKVKKAETAEVASAESKTHSTIEQLVVDPSSGADMLMNDALREAYVNNPTLRAARAQVKATYEKLPQALSNWQPAIGADADVTYSNTSNDPGSDDNATSKSAGLTVDQPLYRGGRTVSSTKAAEALIDAQLATLATTERQVMYSTAENYMDLLQAQATVKVNEKNRDVIARQLKATNDRFNVGDVTRTDVSQSEFRLAEAEAEVTSSIGILRSKRALFEQLVGVMPAKLSLPKFDINFPATVDDAATMAETYNPDVIAAMARHEAAKQDVDTVFGELLPTVSVGAGTSLTRDPSDTIDSRTSSTVGLKLSMPLYEGGAVRSRVREAKYTASELYLKILEARRSAREEAVRSWENLNAARAELRSREAQVRAAEIARDGVRQEAELGERTILDALDSDRELRDAQISLITAKRNEVVGEFALASALGLLVPGNVGIADKVFDFDAFAKGSARRILSMSADTEAESGH